MLRDLIEQEIRNVLVGEVEQDPHAGMGSHYKIVIGTNGFVWCGLVHFENDYVRIDECKNIRKWGTSKGLGELAKDGVQSETVLDDVGTLRVHKLAIVGLIDSVVLG